MERKKIRARILKAGIGWFVARVENQDYKVEEEISLDEVLDVGFVVIDGERRFLRSGDDLADHFSKIILFRTGQIEKRREKIHPSISTPIAHKMNVEWEKNRKDPEKQKIKAPWED